MNTPVHLLTVLRCLVRSILLDGTTLSPVSLNGSTPSGTSGNGGSLDRYSQVEPSFVVRRVRQNQIEKAVHQDSMHVLLVK